MSTRKSLIVVGAGGFAKEVIAAARVDFEILGLCDDDPSRFGQLIAGFPILGAPEAVDHRFDERPFYFCAIGRNQARAEVVARLERLGWRPATVIDPTANVAEGAVIGAGSYIGAGAIVAPSATVGGHAIINYQCSLGHDSIVGDFAQVSPGGRISGAGRLGNGATVGSNAVLAPGVELGAFATLGAGSFALDDVPERATALGVPARITIRMAGEREALDAPKSGARERLQEIFRRTFDDPDLALTDDLSMETFADWDSLAAVQIALAIESEFGRRLTADEVAGARSVSDLMRLIESFAPVVDPSADHLAAARQHGQAGQFDQAFAALRLAVELTADYQILNQAARQLERLRAQADPPSTRRARIALLSSTTADLIAPLIRLACFRDRINAEIYVAPFGSIQQEVRDPNSGLHAFRPDFVILAPTWRDANLPPISEHPEAAVARVVEDWRGLVAELLGRIACRVILHNFEVPAVDSLGQLAATLPGGRARLLRDINRRLVDELPDGVIVLDLDQVAGEFGKRAWADPGPWYLARQYPAAEALPLLVDRQVALIRSALGLARKVLVLDLDNTLWGGVIGEDGLDGIKLGPPSGVGESHQDLQRFALELKQRGVLLAVCSKNAEDEARLPFLRHDATVLTLDDFAIFRANWLDKPTNLRAIAGSLNLGLDSLVFLDDNPAERALVRRELPEVLVPEVGSDPSQYASILDRTRAFEALGISAEDRKRPELYRQDARRAELRETSATLDDFLHDLEMWADLGPIDDSTISRAVQLLGKTNQFNLTSRRHSEAQVRRIARASDHWTLRVRLGDRFGDHGLVGLMIAREIIEDEPIWEIDTWLMSCRVIGRGLESLMLAEVTTAARERGVRFLRGVYVPTRKNGLVASLYPGLGFESITDSTDGEVHYRLDLDANDPARPAFIRVRDAGCVASMV